jgi:hypothetical protein
MTDRSESDPIAGLVRAYGLAPHPEGGYYRRVHRSTDTVPTAGGMRPAMTDIYYLLPGGISGRLHRVAHDEVWHFYAGAALELAEIDIDAGTLSRVLLGAGDPVRFKHCVGGGRWQAARSTGAWSLVGCTVAPGFDFADFVLVDDADDDTLRRLRAIEAVAEWMT